MSNQFLSPGGDLENYFITEYWLIDQYVGDQLWAWGNGADGRLGINATLSRSTPVTTFVGGTNWKQVSVGKNHSAAVKTDGTLWTWGVGTSGQLGNNLAANRSTPVTTIVGGNNWKQVSAGADYTAAIKTDGSLWTWGNNSGFQLAKLNTTFAAFSFPVSIDGNNWSDTSTTAPEDLYTLSAGNNFSTAIKTDGTLWTWGLNTLGRLGTNDVITKSTPVTTFAGGTDWKELNSGGSHIAAIKTDGTLWVWGTGTSGQLGANAILTRSTPITTFTGGTNWRQVSAGGLHTAAIKTDGTLWTWGSDAAGQLGRPTTSLYEYIPVTTFAGGNNWADTPTSEPEDLYTLSAGNNFSTAIKTDGTLWTWGEGALGKLGINATTNRSTPVTTFIGGTDWKQISSGGTHTAAIKTDGTLWVWGNGVSGQLGDNTVTSVSTPVTTFTGGTNWRQVSTGSQHTVAVKTDGTLWSWGLTTSGQLGRLSNVTFKYIPVTTFAGGTNWADTATSEPEDLYTLSAGTNFSAAIKTDGTLWVWGEGADGKLGINATTNRSTPVTTFAGGIDWKQISSGGTHTAAIKTDGTLWVWGNGAQGRLGINATTNRSTPVTTFAGGTDWKQVSSGGTHTAAIKTDGTLWTWGLGSSGQLGANNVISRSTPVTTFAGGTNWKQVSAGDTHTAAIKTDGTLWVWGLGTSGQLGANAILTRSTPVTTFTGGTDWKQVNSGTNFSAAVKTDGTLWTWGLGSSGQLGTNATVNRSAPTTTFAGGTDWKQTHAGSTHVGAVKTDGTLWVWGAGGSGRLGTADGINRSTPVTTFIGGTNWKQVNAGADHTLALKDDGVNKELYVFGDGSTGELGINAFDNGNNIPAKVFPEISSDWKHVDAGFFHTAAVKTDGTLWNWGDGGFGRLGTNDTVNRETPVTTFAGGTNWKQASAGDRHTSAVKTDGTLWVWGEGAIGKLGTNDTINRSTPVTTFAGGTDWKQVSNSKSSSGFFTSAVKTDGTLWVWGNNSRGNLGTADIITRSTPVTTFAGGTDWKQVSAGENHTLALKDDGVNKELYVFGDNSTGELGIDFYVNPSSIPVQVFPKTSLDWKQVSAGFQHTVAIKVDGTLWVWGNGNSGRLGDNTVTTALTPVTTFAGGTNWSQVGAGTSHTAAVKTDGTLWTWGLDSSGQLGDNTVTTVSTPVTTFVGGTDWKQVSAGDLHTVAVKIDGTLWTWGNGSLGRLGTNDTLNRSTPVQTYLDGTNWKQVSAGYNHTIALEDTGASKVIYAFGNHSGAFLGFIPTVINYSSPTTTFAGGTNWKQVSSGTNQAAALKSDGTLWVWGLNASGQLGINNVSYKISPVTTFAGGTNWKQVSSGESHISAVKYDGTLWIWGNGSDGRLGTNDLINRSTPVTTFAGGDNWKQVSSGYSHTAAIKEGNSLWVWGNGGSGRLGTNDTIDRSTPVTTFVGGTNWKQVYSALNHTVAIKSDATLWTWGNGSDGKLGTNDTVDRLTPTPELTQGDSWKQASAGDSQTAAVKSGINLI